MVGLGSGRNRIYSGKPKCSCRRPWQRVGCRGARTGPEVPAYSLPVVWPGFQTAFHRWIDTEVLLHGTSATVLDRGAPLDDAGDRGGPNLGRLLEGVSYE